jgi:hypothetical protein
MFGAKVNTVQRCVFAGLITLVTHPSDITFACSWVNAASVVAAVVQADGHVAVVAFPSREARANVGNEALAVSA